MTAQLSGPARAALWMMGAVFSFSAMAIAGREAGLSLDTFEIMTYRSLAGLIVVCAVLSLTGRWHQVSRARLGAHLLRNICHFTGQNLWFFAVTLIPLAQVFALEFTSPLWVILLSPLLLGEALTRHKAATVALGFAGILIVARPSPETLNAGIAAAAGCAVFFALTAILTKRLTRFESTGSILFWLTLMQLGMGLLAAGWDGSMALPAAATLPWLVLIGLAGLSAHFCLTTALSMAPASVVAPVDFARLPLIAVLGMLIYGEALEIWVLSGAALICLGNYLNLTARTVAKTPA
ncbi:DMT family transporter [Cribrihabitans neustonicus]|uniref:DMT family transporter n=1 Tax=Cribrihabitans neustonicus TaxID=1429085 RepID=UPI003B5A2E54